MFCVSLSLSVSVSYGVSVGASWTLPPLLSTGSWLPLAGRTTTVWDNPEGFEETNNRQVPRTEACFKTVGVCGEEQYGFHYGQCGRSPLRFPWILRAVIRKLRQTTDPSSLFIIIRIITYYFSSWPSVSAGTLLPLLSNLSLQDIWRCQCPLWQRWHTNRLI